MEREPVRGSIEEGGRSQLKQGRAASVQAPGPLDDREAGLEASVRMKLASGEPLDPEERAFLGRLPGDKDAYVPP